MRSSIGIMKSPSLAVVKDSTPSQGRILRFLNFGIFGSQSISAHTEWLSHNIWRLLFSFVCFCFVFYLFIFFGFSCFCFCFLFLFCFVLGFFLLFFGVCLLVFCFCFVFCPLFLSSKYQTSLLSYVQNYSNRKPFGRQPTLHSSWINFKWVLPTNDTVIYDSGCCQIDMGNKQLKLHNSTWFIASLLTVDDTLDAWNVNVIDLLIEPVQSKFVFKW